LELQRLLVNESGAEVHMTNMPAGDQALRAATMSAQTTSAQVKRGSPNGFEVGIRFIVIFFLKPI
jgi:hypothetical protein